MGYDLALTEAHLARQRPAEALVVARRLTAAWPDSERAFAMETGILARLRRWDELRAAAGRRLERKADDPAALRTLIDVAMRQGDFAEIVQLRERMTRTGSPSGRDLNQIAWAALVFGRTEEADLDSARRATELTGYKEYASLHTLASLYAEAGKTAEAYRVILQAMELRNGEPGSSDWYVFGRLAEQYELPDLARGYYERVEPDGNDPKDPDPASTYHLARRRLAALPKAGRGSEGSVGVSRPISSKN
jgi:tetratricopeptide (TPR) repeat protein